MQIGLIGFGYWGKLLAKTVLNDDRVSNLYIVSNQPALHAEVAASLSGSRVTHQIVSLTQLLALPLDGVLVATPEETHAYYANLLLNAGLACFIEKPLALTVQEATSLITKAQHNQCILQVDQVFHYDQQFSEFVQVARQYIPTISNVVVYRSAPMMRQKHVSVIGDTFPHDLYQLRLGFGLELQQLTSVVTKSFRLDGQRKIASEVTVSGVLAQSSVQRNIKQNTLAYDGLHSWCGSNKQRLFVVGNRATNSWVKWILSDSKVPQIQVWHNNTLVQTQNCLVPKNSPVTQMIAAWLSTLNMSWSDNALQMKRHWEGVLKDSYWLDQALKLSVKDQHIRQ